MWSRFRRTPSAPCASSRTSRGRAFDVAARVAGLPALDACAPEPVVSVASFSSTEITRPTWERLYEHALAASHDVQEALAFSIETAHLALERAPETPVVRAAILTLEADVLARTGRRDEALAVAARDEALVGTQPAIDRARGHAEAQVWRWAEAADAFGRVALAAPLDTEAQRDHARALGSMARGPETLAATALGLRLFPRDEQLLRSQSLAIGDLGEASGLDDETIERARQAFVRYRRPDDETQLRLACEQGAEGCAQDRLPVRVITLE